MNYLIEWVTNIILFILLATIIDMLLPNSNMQKYIKIVTGLLLIAIILGPVLKFINQDFEAAISSLPTLEGSNDGAGMENLIESKKKEIQASQHAYILEQMAVQLTSDAKEELMEQYGLQIDSITVEADPSDKEANPEIIQRVVVTLKEPASKNQLVAVVKPVEIQASGPISSQEDLGDTEEIGQFLSERWNLPENTIIVAIEGGISRENE